MTDISYFDKTIAYIYMSDSSMLGQIDVASGNIKKIVKLEE